VCVVGAEPISLGILSPPADYGADIVCGDIQSLGMHMQFGGGQAGFIATRDDPRYVLEYPSRLFGIAPTGSAGLMWYQGEIELSLDATDAADRRDFVDSLLDSEPNVLDEGFRAALLRRTDGQALFTVELLRAERRFPVRVIERPGSNISQGRNAAIAEASGDVIVSTDAGVRLDPQWLEKLVAPLALPYPCVSLLG
jgi:glycosyltransferase involved in cell wall biosynthesis